MVLGSYKICMCMQMNYNLSMNTDNTLPSVCITALQNHLRPVLFKSLCDPTRLSMVAYLATLDEPVTVGTLADLYGIDFSGVSRHLKILREAEVVTASKQGREVKYSLNLQELTGTLRGFADALDFCSDSTK